MTFGIGEGRLGSVLLDATSLFSGISIVAEIQPQRYPKDSLRELYENARAAAGSGRAFLDTLDRPTAKLQYGGSDLNDALTFAQQGVGTGDAKLPTLTLVARSWS